MKKFSLVFSLALVLVTMFSAVACAPVNQAQQVGTSGAIVAVESVAPADEVPPLTLPNELADLLVLGVGGLVTWLVVAGIKGLVEALGGSFDGFWGKLATSLAAVISAGAVSSVLGIVNVLLALVPPEAVPAVSAFLAFLVVALSAMGIQRQNKKAIAARSKAQ